MLLAKGGFDTTAEDRRRLLNHQFYDAFYAFGG